MDFKQIKEMTQDFNNRFAKIAYLENSIARATVRQQDALAEENEKLAKNMQKSIDEYVNFEIGKTRDNIHKMIDSFGDEMVNVAKGVKQRQKDGREKAESLVSPDFETNKETVLKLFKEMNDLIEKLNTFDFNGVEPVPVIGKVAQNAEHFTVTTGAKVEEIGTSDKSGITCKKSPHIDLLRKLQIKSDQCLEVLDAMEADIRRRITTKTFKKYLSQRATKYMGECAATFNRELDRAIKRQLKTNTGNLQESRFQEISDSGNNGKVNFDEGSMTYSTRITLGNMRMSYLDKKDYTKYITDDTCPLLAQHTPNGILTAPYVLELKKNGNMFITYDSSKPNGATIDLIRKTMLSFLMALPAGLVNYQLIDMCNTGEFASFNQLNKIDNKIFGTTLGDDAPVDSAMTQLAERMRDIFDNKISQNEVKDIYSYNIEKSENDPQSFTVLVIIGFPECFSREKTVKWLSRLIEDGNRSGIFTIIAYDKNFKNQPAYISEFIKEAKKHMNCFEVHGGKIYIDGNRNYELELSDDADYKKLADYAQTMKQNIKKGTNKVIPLSKMYEATDKLEGSEDVPDPTEVIDIPIGMRGGEVQTLAFSSMGDGSAHALAIGGTGSGKSNLLHAIVMSACYKYSPNDLNIYLVDFKGGVEFKYYEANRVVEKQLPQVKLTALSSDPEDGLAVLANIDKEMTRRETLFRNSNVEDIMQYKKVYGKTLPRLLVIIDEVQELFERDSSIGSYAINLMSKLFKKGRAFGINILWASQNVPKVAGLKDKIISQVGSRISLKLNNPDDAQDLGISVQKVANLSNTLGVGVIKDARTKNGVMEFRVAYAESSDNRDAYAEKIIEKWADTVKAWPSREPVFVVGNNLEEPSANVGTTPFTHKPTAADVVAKSTGEYNIAIGQDYISGKPFSIPIRLRGSNSNLWFAGANVEELRDMMGFAMLSVEMENRTNKDCVGDTSDLIYYFNGEVVDQRNPDDLFFVLPKKMPRSTKVVATTSELKDTLVKLYNLRKKRAEDIQKTYNPVFLFINKLQEIATDFKDTSKLIDVSEKAETTAPIGTSSSLGFSFGLGVGGAGAAASGNKMTFAQLFNEVFENGPNQNIHVIFSIDKPSSIPSINTAMRNCQNKVFIRGLDADAITAVASFRSNIKITIDGLGVCLTDTEMNKFKPYRYYTDRDAAWFEQLVNDYNAL